MTKDREALAALRKRIDEQPLLAAFTRALASVDPDSARRLEETRERDPDERMPALLDALDAEYAALRTPDTVDRGASPSRTQIERWIDEIAPACVDNSEKNVANRRSAMFRLWERIDATLSTPPSPVPDTSLPPMSNEAVVSKAIDDALNKFDVPTPPVPDTAGGGELVEIAVTAWHESSASLPVWLGWSETEYAAWVADPAQVPRPPKHFAAILAENARLEANLAMVVEALGRLLRAADAMSLGVSIHNRRAIDRHVPIEGDVVTELQSAAYDARTALSNLRGDVG